MNNVVKSLNDDNFMPTNVLNKRNLMIVRDGELHYFPFFPKNMK